MITAKTWEPLPAEDTWRMVVPGGWLIRVDNASIRNNYDRNISIDFDTIFQTSLVFLPDPNHEWDMFDKQLTNVAGLMKSQ